jgi:excisionase family DNA binding protein
LTSRVQGKIQAFRGGTVGSQIRRERPWLTELEVARRLNVSVRTVQRLMAAGHFRVIRLSSKFVRISRESVDKFIEQNMA